MGRYGHAGGVRVLRKLSEAGAASPVPKEQAAVCTRKFYKNKQLTGTKMRYVRKYTLTKIRTYSY
jgi:hypothetical protein